MSGQYALPEAKVRHELLRCRGAKWCGIILGQLEDGSKVVCQVITQGGIAGQKAHQVQVHGGRSE